MVLVCLRTILQLLLPPIILGEYDYTFSCYELSSIRASPAFHSGYMASNFSGKLGGKMVLVPNSASCLGTFDPTTKEVACHKPSGIVPWSFGGASELSSGQVVYAPLSSPCIGVYAAATDSFSCSVSLGWDYGYYFFSGHTHPSGLLVFAPGSESGGPQPTCIGVFNLIAGAFTCIDVEGVLGQVAQYAFYGGAMMPDGLLVLAPTAADCVREHPPGLLL